MKRTLLLLSMALLLSAPAALAQFNKGRWLADGSMSLSANKNESHFGTTVSNNSSTSFGFSPSVGYFLIDRLAGGVRLSAGTTQSTGQSFNPDTGTVEDVTRNSNSVSVGPFLRYYLPVGFFVHASTTFGVQKLRSDAAWEGPERKGNEFNWYAGIGYAWFLNDYVAVEPALGYQSSSIEYKANDNGFKSGSFAISVGLAIYLGERK